MSPPRTEVPYPANPPVSAVTARPLPDSQPSTPAAEFTDAIDLPVDPNLIAFDELNKKPITNPDGLKAAFRHLYHLRHLSGEEIDLIRKRLTAWADSIPHHKITEFGGRIKVIEAVVAPYYRFTLGTQYESREVERKEEPYHGAGLPSLVTNEGNIRIWAYPFTLTEDFTPAQKRYCVDDSQRVLDCHSCRATGKLACGTCTSKGRVICPTCSALGRLRCPKCGGNGRVTKYRQEVRSRRPEWFAFGDIWFVLIASLALNREEKYTVTVPYQELCSVCAGSGLITCGICNGTKEVQCSTCIGTGRVTCRSCNGQRKVVNFLEIHDIFEPIMDTRSHPNPNLKYDCTNLLVTDDYHILMSISHPIFSPSIADSLDNKSLKGLIVEAIRTSRALRSPTKRIVMQSINIQRANVVFMKYTYNGVEQQIYVCGNILDGKVFAPHSPISKATDDIFLRSVNLLNTGEVGMGLEELRKTFDIGQRNNEAQSLLEAVRAKLAGAYMAGATLLSKDGLWPESLYYSDRAKVLVPRSPSVAQHEAKIKWRMPLLHVGPPIVIGLVAIIIAALLQQPLILLAAVAAIGAGVACQFLLGIKICGTMQALVHSGTLAAALAFGVGVAADAETPAVPLSAIAIILILDIFLFRVLRTTLLRSDPPKPISPDPHDAIPRISKLISEDWQNIARNYVEMN